jgi:cholesterol transport system auxiliary component
MTRALVIVLSLVAGCGSSGCGGSVPPTRFYHLAPAAAAPATALRGDAIIVVDSLDTDAGYDDDRMVYRVSPYRFDYYEYHRWSASPGTLVERFLEQALERTGAFGAVVRTHTTDAAVILSGRVAVIEEVDRKTGPWLGHLVIELRLADATTGDVVWSRDFDVTEPMPSRSPDGLARAISRALDRVVKEVVAPAREVAARHAAARTQAAASR